MYVRWSAEFMNEMGNLWLC